MMKTQMVNAMTIDVEDFFQVSAFESIISRQDWNKITPRVERNTHKILELLASQNAKATFFVLGWVADRFPQLIREIADLGHEIGCHSYWHFRAYQQTQVEFKTDLKKSKDLLEQIIGQAIHGYRAPSFSINDQNQWVYDELGALGFQYSSSIYPIRHDHYGSPTAARFKTKIRNIWEIPMSTLKIAQKNIPIAGGGYFRLYPYQFTSWAIRRYLVKEQRPYIFYLHPWELDPKQPKCPGLPLKSRIRHYINLPKVELRFRKLLSDFNWSTMQQVFLAKKE